MKRSGPLQRRTPLKSKTCIRVKGISETADLKDEIQRLVREIVITRDGGCILDRHYPDIPPCNGYRKDGQLILQADHLITRANSATFADTRLIVTLCKGHHGWKSVGSNARKAQYDAIVKTILPAERVQLWERCEADSWRPHRTGAYDWRLALTALRQELATYA